jgi:hypothetical protein
MLNGALQNKRSMFVAKKKTQDDITLVAIIT